MSGAPVPVDLWLWPLDAETPPTADPAALLSPDETARAARFVLRRDALRHVAARGGLRRILGLYTQSPPRSLRFAYGPGGKPRLPGGPSFNLSHSGGWAALAVGPPGLSLGLDIEKPRLWDPCLARTFLSAREYATLTALPPEDRAGALLRCWTRKEALIKAEGGGLAIPLDSFSVGHRPGVGAVLEAAAPPLAPAGEWLLHDLDLADGYAGALALRASAIRVRRRDRHEAGL